MGTVNSDPVSLGTGKCHDLSVALPLDNPNLWDLNQPSLYRAVCELQCDGETADRATTSFGIRDAILMESKDSF